MQRYGLFLNPPNFFAIFFQKLAFLGDFWCFPLFLGWFLVFLVLVFVIWVGGGVEGDFTGIRGTIWRLVRS